MIELTEADFDALRAAVGSTSIYTLPFLPCYRAGLAAGIERAAMVCEEYPLPLKWYGTKMTTGKECAAAIRALLDNDPGLGAK
jgi:hypothetical protein